jgi:hypothetical protein
MLRERVEQHNRGCLKPAEYEQVVVYAGQSVLSRSEMEKGNGDE